MKKFNFHEIMALEQRYRANFINSIAGFKAATLVGSVNNLNQTNLAIFNSIFHVGANPPLLGMVVRPDEVERHTLQNIQESKHYTFNHINPIIVRAAHQTSARYPKEISEFDATGLTPMFSEQVKAPYVAESKVKIGLEFKEKIDIALNNTSIIIGQIIEIFVDETAVSYDGFVNLEVMESCTVAGLDAYYKTTLIERLTYAKPNTLPTNIPIQ